MVVRSALRTGRLYPPGNAPGTHFCSRLSRLQGHNAIGRILWLTPAWIEPATFRFVAQRLNHCATAVPRVLCAVYFIVVRLHTKMHAPCCSDSLICSVVLKSKHGLVANLLFHSAKNISRGRKSLNRTLCWQQSAYQMFTCQCAAVLQ